MLNNKKNLDKNLLITINKHTFYEFEFIKWEDRKTKIGIKLNTSFKITGKIIYPRTLYLKNVILILK